MHHEVDIVYVPALTSAVLRFHIRADDLPTIGERVSEAIETVGTALVAADVRPQGAPVAYYRPDADGFEVDAGFRIPAEYAAPKGLTRLELEETEAAHTTHIGPYGELPSAYADLMTELAASGKTPDLGGWMWEEYCSAPGTPAEQTRTEIYWPVSPSAAT